MEKKQFQTESKKLLDLMINSIYTHKEIFLRELISNASDALDKRYYQALKSGDTGVMKKDFKIELIPDKDAGTLTIRDNGIGMTEAEMESNLGTIAKSGSQAFREQLEKEKGNNDKKENPQEITDIIGQFGVGFYSAFMVADKITVTSKSEFSDSANTWESSGADGYTIEPAEKDSVGTDIVLHLKKDEGDETYSEYLEDYRLENLVKKYSDYIHYPILLGDKTLNSMEPIWKSPKGKVKPAEYASYYKNRFGDYEDPARVIRTQVEGISSYTALLFIPKHAPFNYYTKEFEKGLALYSSGVLIMEKCKDLIPDCFSFVQGLVDSQDLSLNISRETLQHNRQLQNIRKNLEKKIKKELKDFLKDDREGYESFFKAFGLQLKGGLYESYGADKDLLADLLLFYSSKKQGYVTLDEYIEDLPEGQDKIWYAPGETLEKIAMLPQVRAAVADGKSVLYLTDDIDEFLLKMLQNYKDKQFASITDEIHENESDDEKNAAKEAEEENKPLLDFMKETLKDRVSEVRFTTGLKDSPCMITSKGEISIEMEKTLNRMPNQGAGLKAELVLALNADHPAIQTLKKVYGEGTGETNKENAAKITRLLLDQSLLLAGLTIDDPLQMEKDLSSLIAASL
ncbi:MAG: molecular chaperone HtpG [Eubacteriales bacterium]|nr:molecular chaperone HtpG [Eubacteriales bacterium]